MYNLPDGVVVHPAVLRNVLAYAAMQYAIDSGMGGQADYEAYQASETALRNLSPWLHAQSLELIDFFNVVLLFAYAVSR